MRWVKYFGEKSPKRGPKKKVFLKKFDTKFIILFYFQHGYDQEEKDPVFAEIDEKILKDSRVLKNLIHHESACIPATKDYLRYHQTKLDPTMRKIVVRWMLEVTQDSRSQPDVFLLSVNVLDRFLSVCPQIDKNKLQLIATTALLVSSKFKDTTPFSGEKLIFYTDDSVTPAELRVSCVF